MVSLFDFHRSDRGSNPGLAVKFHNVYDHTIVRHLHKNRPFILKVKLSVCNHS